MEKGTLDVKLVSKIKNKNGADTIGITGILHPKAGLELNCELELTAEAWQLIARHVAWEMVQSSINEIRERMEANRHAARSIYICPSCGERRYGHQESPQAIFRTSAVPIIELDELRQMNLNLRVSGTLLPLKDEQGDGG